MSATSAKQFEGFAKCCLDLARSTKTATHRVRFVEMAHEYWLASLLIRNELSSDMSAGHAYHNGGTNWPSKAATLFSGGASDGEGLGSLAAEPRSPTPKTWVIRAEYRGGNWPNTRNPAGGADGVWVGSVGGMLPKLAMGQRGSGGRAVQLAINHLVARRRKRFRPGGTRYRISIPAERGGHQRPGAEVTAEPCAVFAVKKFGEWNF